MDCRSRGPARRDGGGYSGGKRGVVVSELPFREISVHRCGSVVEDRFFLRVNW
jgi:hypothetical protein